MEIDWVLLVMVAVAFGAGALGVWLLFARERDPGLAEAVQLALATVARLATQTLSEDELAALASWAYDQFGVSEYYSRAQFVDWVLRVIRLTEPVAAMAPAGLVTRNS